MFQNPYLQQLPFLILIIVIWYFFFLRPGSKEKQVKRNFFDNLKVGDPVITVGGIHGVITDIQDQQIVIALGTTAQSSQMKLQKEAIAVEITQQVYPKESTDLPKKEQAKLAKKASAKSTKRGAAKRPKKESTELAKETIQ